MRIGVVSDTHNHLPNVRQIVALFNEARVERVIHTGDISQPKTLDVLSELDAGLWGVFGNNDERDALHEAATQHGMALSEGPLELTWAERRIIVVHDPLELDGHLRDHHDVVLHGHTHRRTEERDDGRLVFNPGECAGHMKGLNAIGVLDLASLETELLKF